jgi:chemotaxis signal transduction protein
MHQYLSFQLLIGKGLIETRELVEVLHLKREAIVKIPGVSGCVKGVCNWRGEVLWVVDFGELLGIGGSKGIRQTSVMVVQREDQTVGLEVESVGEIEWVNVEGIERVQPPITEAIASCSSGQWKASNGEVFHVFSGAEIFNTLRLSDRNILPTARI